MLGMKALDLAEASPSSRRAWIEITTILNLDGREVVALLAEGVDRNCQKHSLQLMA